MMVGEGYSMAGTPYQHLTVAQQAALLHSVKERHAALRKSLR